MLAFVQATKATQTGEDAPNLRLIHGEGKQSDSNRMDNEEKNRMEEDEDMNKGRGRSDHMDQGRADIDQREQFGTDQGSRNETRADRDVREQSGTDPGEKNYDAILKGMGEDNMDNDNKRRNGNHRRVH